MAKRQDRNTSSLRRNNSISRQPRESILIVVEGKETEYNYFEELRNQLRLPTVDVKVKSSKKSDPLGVVEYANSLEKQRLDESKKSLKSPYNKIYCVIDGDHPNRDNYRSATQNANQYKYQLIVSIPCFELWFFLHFEYSTQAYQNCDQLCKHLKKYVPNYDKAMTSFKEFFDRIEVAIKNSQLLDNFHKENDSTEIILQNPSSQVYSLVELLINQKQFKA